MNIAQIGMGYIGLTNAIHFAMAGHTVACYDVDKKVIESINQGKPKSGEFLQYIQEDFGKLVKDGKIVGISSYDYLQYKNAYFISVPTEKRDKPFMDIVESVIIHIVCNMEYENVPLIIIESTLTPGFCKKIENTLKNNRKYVDKDYFLAVAPRRDWFADPDKNLTNMRRVVGGISKESTERACEVIMKVCPNIDITTSEIAELTKSLENTIFNAQISVIEYLSLMYPNVDVNEAVHLATHGHWRLTPLQLNSGIGGRCIPLALDYLKEGCKNNSSLDINNSSVEVDFFKSCRQVDLMYRNSICELIEKYVNKFNDDCNFLKLPNVVIFGLGYRKDFKDIGWSPGKYFYKNLLTYKDEYCYNLFITDPLFSETEIVQMNIEHYSFNSNSRWNILVLSTKHSYINKKFKTIMKMSDFNNSVLIDACGAFDEEENISEYLKDMGITYVRVGSAGWKDV